MADFFKKICLFFLAAITAVSSFFGLLFPQVTVFTDLSYGSSDAQKVDLYLPKTRAAGCTAIVVYIHGGAWTAGDKNVYDAACKKTAEQGYAAVTVNYRMLGEGATWVDMLSDITSALNLVKTTAAEKGITLKKAAFTGASAGGHLAMLYSFKNQYSSPIEVAFCASQCGPSDFTDIGLYENSADSVSLYSIVSSLINQKFDKSTFYDFTPQLQAASPVTYITKDSPPTIVAQGEKDPIVKYTQGIEIYDTFTKAGAHCDLILYPNSDHGLSSDPDCSARYDKLFKEYELKYFGY